MLAGRTTAKVLACHEYARAFVAWIVKREIRIQRAVRGESPIVKRKLPKTGALNPLKELLGNNLVRIDVCTVKWGDKSCVRAKRLHHLYSHSRTSVKCPFTAAAAAMAGLTR